MIPGISGIRRLPRLGIIRLGEKKQGERGAYPSALDHFLLKDAPAAEAVYGKECRSLDIVFPTENPEVFFGQDLRAYRKSGLFCKCSDGHTATRVRLGLSDGLNTKTPKGQPYDPVGEDHLKKTGEDVEVGRMFEMPCLYPECSFFAGKFCKGIGRLLFLLPKVPAFGCWQITTTSWNSMVAINSYVQTVREAAGRVSFIPFKLNLVPQQARVEGKAKTIHVLQVVFEGGLGDLLKYRRKELAAPIPAASLPEPSDKEVPDDLVANEGAALDAELGTGPKMNPAARGAVRLEDILPPKPERNPAEPSKPERNTPAERTDPDEAEAGRQAGAMEPERPTAPAAVEKPKATGRAKKTDF